MDATGIGMAIADMPREMFKGKGRSKSSGPADESSGSPSTPPESSTSNLVKGSGDAEESKDGKQSPPTPSIHTRDEHEPHTPATTGSGSSGRSAPKKTPSNTGQDSSSAEFNFETAVDAGKNVGKIVTTGVKSPMNFCLGLAKGFRNVPTLYNDDTVRPVEKVTGIGSGIRIASKEFGYGLFDGISGLVTQPLKGAEKDGAGGLVKGFGKGIGGLIAKPAAGEFLFILPFR